MTSGVRRSVRMMQAVEHLQGEMHRRILIPLFGVDCDVVYVRIGAGDRRRDLGQHAALVFHHELDADVEKFLGFGRPFDVDDFVEISACFCDGRTIVVVP